MIVNEILPGLPAVNQGIDMVDADGRVVARMLFSHSARQTIWAIDEAWRERIARDECVKIRGWEVVVDPAKCLVPATILLNVAFFDPSQFAAKTAVDSAAGGG